MAAKTDLISAPLRSSTARYSAWQSCLPQLIDRCLPRLLVAIEDVNCVAGSGQTLDYRLADAPSTAVNYRNFICHISSAVLRILFRFRHSLNGLNDLNDLNDLNKLSSSHFTT